MAAYGTATIGTTAATILASNTGRTAIVVQNNHASNDLYIGSDDSVATTTGLHLAAGESIRLHHHGTIFGIASAASTDVRYFEETF